MHLLNIIGGPQQAHGVQSPEEYLALAEAARVQRGFKPVLFYPEVRPMAYVSDGRWVVDCPCGNGPSASPEWELAACLECGAVYRPVFPDDREDVEAALLARPHPRNRHFFCCPMAAARAGLKPEKVRDIERENVAFGLAKRRPAGLIHGPEGLQTPSGLVLPRGARGG